MQLLFTVYDRSRENVWKALASHLDFTRLSKWNPKTQGNRNGT